MSGASDRWAMETGLAATTAMSCGRCARRSWLGTKTTAKGVASQTRITTAIRPSQARPRVAAAILWLVLYIGPIGKDAHVEIARPQRPTHGAICQIQRRTGSETTAPRAPTKALPPAPRGPRRGATRRQRCPRQRCRRRGSGCRSGPAHNSAEQPLRSDEVTKCDLLVQGHVVLILRRDTGPELRCESGA